MKPTILFLIFSALGIAASAKEADPLDAAISSLVSVRPSHHLNNAEARAALVNELRATEAAHGVPADLLLTVAFFESSLLTTAKGARGEIGILQVAPGMQTGCDMATRRGQLDCGARILRDAFDTCGSWSGALTRYAQRSGNCRPDTERVRKLVKYRIAKWREIAPEKEI